METPKGAHPWNRACRLRAPVHVGKHAAARGDKTAQRPQGQRILLDGTNPPVPQPRLAFVQVAPSRVPVRTCKRSKCKYTGQHPPSIIVRLSLGPCPHRYSG